MKTFRIFAHHGCLKEETKIGSEYRVDLEVDANLRLSADTDLLNDTVDYVFLNRIIREEMLKPSQLLETVAKRILDRIFAEDEKVANASVSVGKINPPIGGDVQMVTIKMTENRKNYT